MPAAFFGIQQRHAASGAGISQKVGEHPKRQGKRRPPPKPQQGWQAQPDPEQRDPRERVQRTPVTEFVGQNAGGQEERLEASPQAQVLDGGAGGVEVRQKCAEGCKADDQARTAAVLNGQRPYGSGDDPHQPDAADAQGNVSGSGHTTIFVNVLIGEDSLALLVVTCSKTSFHLWLCV